MCCAVLVFGGIIGTSVLKILPENVIVNLFSFLNNENENFKSIFMNRFCFPAVILMVIYFSGFGLLGRFTALFAMFINGAFFAFENGLKYMFFGAEYFSKSMVSYFTATIFMFFLLLIMTENAICSSSLLNMIINNKNAEKPHFKAKKITVKFVAFTSAFAVFSAFSAYILTIFQKFL